MVKPVLRESAANDNSFKRFSYTSFSLQEYIPTHLKPKLYRVVWVFSRYMFSNGQPISSPKLGIIFLVYIPFIYIHPEELYVMEKFKGIFFLYVILSVTKLRHEFETGSE